MAHSIAGAFKKNRNDEMYTPKILVDMLKPYFEQWLGNKKCIVWCPFDTEESEYVHFFKGYNNVEVVFSHIDAGQDFFEYEPEQWDIAISNIPFSRKLDIFKRLNELRKPWVMLCNIMCLNYQEIGHYFADHPVQMLIPDKRVSFDGNPSSFCSGYFCKDFLSSDLMFCHVENNNAGRFHVPSRMYN